MTTRVFASMTLLALLLGLAACDGKATVQPSQAPTAAELANEAYLQVFETVWKTVNETYFDPTFGGLDWSEVYERYRPQIAAAQDDEVFYVRSTRCCSN